MRRPSAVLALALLIAFGIGCAPARMLPDGFDETGVAPARIDEGRGVRFLSLDGERVRRRSILVAPGSHSVRADVRRALGPLDEDQFEGIYRVGECRLRLDVEAGRRYEVYTEIFVEERARFRHRRPRPIDDETETETVVGLTVHVKDVETGRSRRLSADSCELRLDCTRINRLYSKTGKECSS